MSIQHYQSYKLFDGNVTEEDRSKIKALAQKNKSSTDEDVDLMLAKLYKSLNNDDRKEFDCYVKRFAIENELRLKLKRLNTKFDCENEDYSMLLVNCKNIKETDLDLCSRQKYKPEEYDSFFKMQLEQGKLYNSSIVYTQLFLKTLKALKEGNIEKAKKYRSDMNTLTINNNIPVLNQYTIDLPLTLTELDELLSKPTPTPTPLPDPEPINEPVPVPVSQPSIQEPEQENINSEKTMEELTETIFDLNMNFDDEDKPQNSQEIENDMNDVLPD